ncbi:MAG TPA: histidine--tRNA ligase [Cyclobacteriaceae bacterium]|nr:histidine--tRNA ligase [Cyclobacteriaceae bacterium]
MSQKPSLPKGTRDFGPKIMARRKFIIEHIAATFKKYGFLPLETPAMENLTTLTGKYGDEGDKLLFNVLESGDFYSSSGVEVSKINYFLLQSIKQVAYELLGVNNDKFKNVQYLDLKQARNSEALKEWLSKYYKIICKGRMVEGLSFEYAELNTIIETLENRLGEISILLSELIRKINFHETIKQSDIDFYIHDLLMTNFSLFYNIINEIFNHQTLRRRFSEKGLRYDLTVPFARFVVMNRNEISFPFKRYQIQPVWRADRPQKGRYREFYQCDADVVGTNSLLCELEIVLMIKEVFQKIGLSDYTIKINHRGILFGLAETLGALGKERMLFTAIDKLDKMEEAQVKKELEEAGFSVTQTTKLFNILNHAAGNEEKLAFLEQEIGKTEQGAKGIKELNEILSLLATSGSDDANLMIDAALARGLSYYTGTIFELKVNNVKIGSVGGGGRYDDLTGIFGLPDVSGVGFSFGIDRIYDVLDELNLFPQEAEQTSKVLITHFDEASFKYGLKVLQQIRDVGIASEIYPDISKIKKQMEYANKKQIPYAIIIGDEEIKTGKLAIKNMLSGEQNSLSIDQILETLQT